MENNTKLMPTLFNNKGMFNREGKRIRAQHLKDITNGTDTFSLWHKVGLPDNEYHHAENDKYYLYVEMCGYLVGVGYTECNIIERIGNRELLAAKYKGDWQNRSKKIARISKAKGYDGVTEFQNAEQQEVNRLGSDESKQADFIKAVIQQHIDTWNESKENNGQTFPDFIGAAAVGELDECQRLRVEYNKVQEQREAERRAQAQAKAQQEHEELNSAAQEQERRAIDTIAKGGTLKNEYITWSPYPGSTKSAKIIIYLMDKYGVKVPLKTRGWIMDKLESVTFGENGSVSYRFWKSRNATGSQSVYNCLFDLIKAVKAEQQQEEGAIA